MSSFLPGLDLSRLFYAEAVQPLLHARFPGLRHAAGLLGAGSDVMGFDTPMSMDHDWGPRVDLFLPEGARAALGGAVDAALREGLPHRVRGIPTRFIAPGDPGDGSRRLDPREAGPVDHRVRVLTVRGFFLDYLAFDVARELEPADWATLPQQKLFTLAAGAVFHDEVGLEQVRRRFSWYPHDVWLYLLAAGWRRIEQEEALMGRAGSVGDEIGSALIGARLVRDVMRLAFLMEQRYAPYPKWFGTAFARLRCAGALSPHLAGALVAGDWEERERHLVPAYEALAALHNALGLTDPLPAAVQRFHQRPFRVIAQRGFAEALLARITDPRVRRMAERRPIGGIDQLSDSTDLLAGEGWRGTLRALYE